MFRHVMYVAATEIYYRRTIDTNFVFTDRSFSQAALTVWNNLPQYDLSNLT